VRHTSKKRAARARSDLPAETMGQIIQLSANRASATPAGECCCGDLGVIRTRLVYFFGDASTGGDAKSAILASRTFARPRHDQIAPASCRSLTQHLTVSYRHSGSCLPRARKQPLGSEAFAGAVRRLGLATGLPDIAVFKMFQVMRPFKPSAPSASLAERCMVSKAPCTRSRRALCQNATMGHHAERFSLETRSRNAAAIATKMMGPHVTHTHVAVICARQEICPIRL